MRVILLSILILAVAQWACATESRVKSMGGIGDFLIDEANVETYPHLAANYGNRVSGKLGGYKTTPEDSGRAIALSLGSSEEPNLGVFSVALYSTVDVPPVILDMFADCDMFDPLGPVLLVGYAKKFESTTIGCQLEWGWQTTEQDTDGTNYHQSNGVIGGNIGAGFKFSENNMLDVMATLKRYRASYETDLWNIEDKSSLSFGTRARYLHHISEKTLIVPIVAFDRVGANRENSQTSGTYDWEKKHSATSGLIGLGFLLPLYEDVTVVVGGLASFESERMKQEQDTTELQNIKADRIVFPHLVAGVETELRPWLIVRVGGQWTTVHLDYDQSYIDTRTRTHDSDFQLNLGIGLRLANLIVDGRLNSDFLFTGSYIMSGLSKRPFADLSFTYGFDLF